LRVAVDTDALILLAKIGKLERFVEAHDACITVVTEYEYVRGEVRAGVAAEESKKDLSTAFDVLPLDNEAVSVASKIWAELSGKGMKLDERDLLIGAICISRSTPLWTLNKKHFERLREFGLELVDVDVDKL